MSMLSDGVTILKNSLMRYAGSLAEVKRNGVTIVNTTVVIARTNFEDADASVGRLNTSYIDVLFSTDCGYNPQIGDIIKIGISTYVVKPIVNEIYSNDDAYNEIIRVHAQRAK